MSQFKSTLLNERWAAKESMKLFNPKKRFNYLVFTMSVVMLLNTLVVRSILVLLLDERCFKCLLVQQEPHEADVSITFCAYSDTNGNKICPTHLWPNDGYVTAGHTSTIFNYPWLLSDQCGSAVIQAYSPVVILELLFSGFLQPASWWLCIDGGDKEVVKWIILGVGMYLSFGLPQIIDLFAEDLDGGKILPGGWASGLASFGVFVFVVLVVWGVKKFRSEGEDDEEEEVEEQERSNWWFLPPVDYLLDIFDYIIDEDRVFGEQEHFVGYSHG
ncbi:hypothetical protein TrLO_g1323 [Triparma laevis f. longispina]|uniref:Uncharacterized protein n=1 Tax=Triparma laevis f. longispina TaxID=1714387 RepID=A0A9W7FSK2_9STRA|nr:hypothetical protein TrLO_g1323 [Triparma laevis f. longispina]